MRQRVYPRLLLGFLFLTMNIDLQLFQELYSNGFHALPLMWNPASKDAARFPEHDPAKVDITIGYVEKLLTNGFNNSNAVAMKLFPPNGMIDFDTKNATDKDVYFKWLNIVTNTNEDVLRKVCIERTRNDGYHVYLKYSKLKDKIPIAREDGKEVISLYTGGLLSYCYPTPGYEIVFNDFASIQDLTDDEFDLLTSTAAIFNKDQDHKFGESKVQLIDYPAEYESACLQFDEYVDDKAFEAIINSIGLYATGKINRKHYVPFLRKGSSASYSAKVYFKSKRVLIFSASMPKFPNWHDCAHSGDTRWTLSPSKLLYYKNDRDWHRTIEEIEAICESLGIDLRKPEAPAVPVDRTKFPYDVFPDQIQDYIFAQVIQHEYLAAGVLSSMSTCIGNSCTLEAMDGYIVKPIIYMAIVAPPGASKTPALKKAFAPIREQDAKVFLQYSQQVKEYELNNALYEKNKKSADKPAKPNLPQTLIDDSTIEMVVKILSHNDMGCCVVSDELSGFLNRMNQYKDGDEVQKWLQMWTGEQILLQRITRGEDKVEKPFCNIIGGIQPGVLEVLAKQENAHNGFYHRFLFCFPEPQQKIDWQPIRVPVQLKDAFSGLFEMLLYKRQDACNYRLSSQANDMYREWFNAKNHRYNIAQEDHIKGIIAKYQDYCLRFALILQVVYDFEHRTGIIEAVNMERAIRLTEYFFSNMHKALKVLKPETPLDRLSKNYRELYNELPVMFSIRNSLELCTKYKISEGAFKMWLQRNPELFSKVERGKFEKIL